MSIQQVGPAYAAVLAAIHGAAFPEAPWGAEAFHVQLEMHGVIGLLDGRGGLILLRLAADEAEILTLGVIPRLRRQGVAAGLLKEGLKRLRALGARTIFLEVEVNNTAARALYTRSGFHEVGRRRHYYANGDDALVLRASLDAAEETAP